MKITRYAVVAVGAILSLLVILTASRAMAHKEKHTAAQLKAFEQVFMEQVTTGDLLFHGDEATQKKLGVQLTRTGMACAMCHPFGSDNHPQEFPKFQEQIGQFATLRDMINWCIEKPNEGVKIDPDSPAMKAIEAYIYWSNRGAKLDPGRH
ncbi:MAG: c-type cytochrome [Anaeromyxobacteraceae bacterium]